MGLIDRGQAALVKRMQSSAGRPLVYTRAGIALGEVVGWVGRTLFSRVPSEPGGAAAVWGDRDYLIAVGDLARIGVRTPAKGDRITEAIEIVVGEPLVFHTFEIVTPDTNEPAWRFSDQTRTTYRLHTKRVA